MKRFFLATILVLVIVPGTTLHGHQTVWLEGKEVVEQLPDDHGWHKIDRSMTQSRHVTVDVLRWMSERNWVDQIEAGPVAAAERLAKLAQEREEAAPQPSHDVVFVSSRFGPRFHPVLRRWRPHNGVDFAAPRGTPILAVEDATVQYRGWLGAAGRAVVLQHDGYTSHYAHMSRFSRGLRSGDVVSRGDVIGFVGASGRATGHHLHFGIKIDDEWVDPLHDGLKRVEPLEDAAVAVGLERGFLDAMRGIQSSAKTAVNSLGATTPQTVYPYEDNFL